MRSNMARSLLHGPKKRLGLRSTFLKLRDSRSPGYTFLPPHRLAPHRDESVMLLIMRPSIAQPPHTSIQRQPGLHSRCRPNAGFFGRFVLVPFQATRHPVPGVHPRLLGFSAGGAFHCVRAFRSAPAVFRLAKRNARPCGSGMPAQV